MVYSKKNNNHFIRMRSRGRRSSNTRNLMNGGINVSFIQPNGESSVIDVHQTDTIRQLKHMLSTRFDMAPGLIHLSFAGENMYDDRTVYDYNIRRDSTILIHKYNVDKKIDVKDSYGKLVASVNSRDNIKTVKLIISAHTGISPNEQRLVYAGKILDKEDLTIDEYGIVGAAIHLIVRKIKNDGK